MQLIQMGAIRSREIVDVLRHYLARAERGDLMGLAVMALEQNRGEDISVAGYYRTQPAQAVSVAMKMSYRLTQMHDAG